MGTKHLLGLYFEINTKAKMFQLSVGHRTIVARSLIKCAPTERPGQVYLFDFTKAISHKTNSDIFEMYQRHVDQS